MKSLTQNQKKPYRGTQAISRAIQLLRVFHESKPEWRPGELCEETGLNRATIYRILSVLEHAGLVAYNADHDAYRLGSEMIVLGARALRANPLREASHAALVSLADKTGEMASLEILEGDQTLILDEVKGAHQRRLNTSVGNLWPAHTTSTGKVLLAHLSQEERAGILSDPLPMMSPQTITDRRALEAQLAQIKSQGYAVVADELEVGFTEVAAPVFDHEGRAIAAISVGGSGIRLSADILPGMVDLVREATGRVSHELGYREG